ncbi:MAG: AAA family ATPase [Lachnospiraceae bacterium]|nr:AAA family ATPase [Lachnospiraceae bacterium]
MYIEHAHITNFRGIEDIDLNFKPGVNILLGDNGTGKTTVLEALTVALGGYLQGIQNLKVGGILQDDFRESFIKMAGASNQIKYHAPKIEFDLNVEGHSYHGVRERSNRAGSGKTSTKCPDIQNYAQQIANEEASNLPLLSYMSISRVTMSRRADYGKAAKIQLNDRRNGYIGCMDSVIDKTSILEWIKKMSYEAVLNHKEMPELFFFQKVVAEIMAEVNELDEKPEIRYSAEFENIAYLENGDIKPVSIMSSGYQSILWMAMDFTFRLALLNPEICDPKEAQGIILIDEIDMHLHPKWQWNILNAFRKTFPNIQFIVATHSPIIIASCEGANLIEIKDFKTAVYLESAFAYSINKVLELRQNSKGILTELQEKIGCFDKYLNSGDLSKAKEVLNEMEAYFGYNNSEVVKARAEYEMETILAE